MTRQRRGLGQNGTYLFELEAQPGGPEGRLDTTAGSQPILVISRPQGVRSCSPAFWSGSSHLGQGPVSSSKPDCREDVQGQGRPRGTREAQGLWGNHTRYDSRARQMAYYREILERVRTVPGIKSAAIVNNLPLSGINSSLNFSIPGPDGKSGPTSARTISPQYFAAMGIPLIEGRDFNDRDQAGAPDVAIINQHLARLLFPDRSPLGQKLSTESGEPGATIVGVVKDSAQTSYEAPFAPEVYIPYQQFVFATFMSTIVVRTEGEPTGLSPMLRKKVWEVDPNQPVVHIQTMEDVVAKSIWRPRFSAWIVSVLSALSLVLIAAGVYAVVATTSALREHELGIRVAVGATASDVSFEILRGALIPLACGLGIGAAAALALSRLLTNLLHGVSSYDPLTYFSAGALLIGIGAAASLRPAWRASTRDPLRTLRAD